LKLEWEIIVKQKAIKRLEEEIKQLEIKLEIEKKRLEEEIKTQRNTLKKKKGNLYKGNILSRMIGSDEKIIKELLEDFLEEHGDLVRENESSYEQKKKNLIKEKGLEEFKEILEEICKTHKKLVELKMQLENLKRTVQMIINSGKYAG